MKMTKEMGRAIELLAGLAGAADVVTLDTLAAKTRVPRGEARRIMDRLARAGLVQGRRGRLGGHRLARALAEITLEQILHAVHGTPGEQDQGRTDLVRSVGAFLEAGTREALGATIAQFLAAEAAA